MRVKMAEAVTTAKLVGAGDVDWALGHAARRDSPTRTRRPYV
jgi:hypothetical protein